MSYLKKNDKKDKNIFVNIKLKNGDHEIRIRLTTYDLYIEAYENSSTWSKFKKKLFDHLKTKMLPFQRYNSFQITT